MTRTATTISHAPPLSARGLTSAIPRVSRATLALAAILAVALGLRFGLLVAGPVHDPQRAVRPDTMRYVVLGHNMLWFQSFGVADERHGVVHAPLYELRTKTGQVPARDMHGLMPETFRTPGYPALFALCELLQVGTTGVLFIQLLLSTCSVLLVYAIGRALFGARVPALIAAALVAIHPGDITAANTLLSETLFTVVMLAGIWLGLWARKHTKAPTVALGGLVYGMAALVRPVSIFLGPCIALWMAVTGKGIRHRLVIPALFVLYSLLPGMWWAVRNHEMGVGYQASTVPSVNAYFYTVTYMDIADKGGDFARDWPAAVAIRMQQLETRMHPGEDVFKAMRRLAVGEVISRPGTYAAVMSHSAGKFMLDHTACDLFTLMGWEYQPSGMRQKLLSGQWSSIERDKLAGFTVAALWTLWNGAWLLATLWGLAVLLRRRRWDVLLLLGGVFAYFIFVTQTNGLERFRLPVLGIQALIIAAAFLPRIHQPGPSPAERPDNKGSKISSSGVGATGFE